MDTNATNNSKSISVVIASGAGGEFLFHCLDSLRSQVEPAGVEVIVVDRCGGETLSRLEREYPFVRVMHTNNRRTSVPELRCLGVSNAKGDIVAIIEEHCLAPANWLEAIQAGFQENDAAVGGPILDNNYPQLTDWVVYFSEYHNYLPPWWEGPRYLLNGANIAYDRQKLLEFRDVLGSGYWEVVLHPSLAANGGFWAVPQMGVHHSGPFEFGYYLRQRYLLSRVWGGTQRNKVSSRRRLTYLVMGPLIPFMMFARITLRVRASRKFTRKFVAATPMLFPVLAAYAWGEWLGYLVGVGNALEEVE